MAWACLCWRDGGGLVISRLSLTADEAGFSGCRVFGGLAVVGQNDRGGLPRPRRDDGGLLTSGLCLLPPGRHVPFLQKEETGDAPVAAVDPVDSEDEEAEDEDADTRTSVIRLYFQ
ncbi:hypothetical protein NDU88_006471 [Pleurodeles waltl]|uniref:Uncharacterized protein n=1 Tax=Pleurodeles waltl TaxID=8319 RepID=A0AAV7UP34_PLEWA|nr:hypothetical protein NDU88_006471 [Pleurodeles waltl]